MQSGVRKGKSDIRDVKLKGSEKVRTKLKKKDMQKKNNANNRFQPRWRCRQIHFASSHKHKKDNN